MHSPPPYAPPPVPGWTKPELLKVPEPADLESFVAPSGNGPVFAKVDYKRNPGAVSAVNRLVASEPVMATRAPPPLPALVRGHVGMSLAGELHYLRDAIPFMTRPCTAVPCLRPPCRHLSSSRAFTPPRGSRSHAFRVVPQRPLVDFIDQVLHDRGAGCRRGRQGQV